MANKAKTAKKQAVGNQTSLLRHVRKEWKLYTFLILPIAYYVIFK